MTSLTKSLVSTTPGVDIVLTTSHDAVEEILDERTLKLIGSLHRRFWERRRTALANRALLGGEVSTASSTTNRSSDVVADLRQDNTTWDDRMGEFVALRKAMDAPGRHANVPTVRIRGWSETEAGVLVDGCAIPGCVFDIAIVLMQGVDLLRAGKEALVVDIAEAVDSEEAKLWADLVTLGEDRTGIDRGTVTVVTSYDVDELAVA